MLYTVEMLARRWGISDREVLAYGTASPPLIFVTDATGCPTCQVVGPGSINAVYQKRPQPAKGLVWAVGCVEQILSQGKGTLEGAFDGNYIENPEIMSLAIERYRHVATVFLPPLTLTQDSLLVTERALRAFETVHPEVRSSVSPRDPPTANPSVLGENVLTLLPPEAPAANAPEPVSTQVSDQLVLNRRERCLEQWLNEQGIPAEEWLNLGNRGFTRKSIYSALRAFPEFKSEAGRGAPISFESFVRAFWKEQQTAKISGG